MALFTVGKAMKRLGTSPAVEGRCLIFQRGLQGAIQPIWLSNLAGDI